MHLQLSLPGRQKLSCFFTAGCYLGSFLALVLQTGEPSVRFRPHTSQKESWPLKYPSEVGSVVQWIVHWTSSDEMALWNFSCLLWVPSQHSHASSALSASLIVMKWFLLSILGYKTSLQLVFSWLFRIISLQFSCSSTLVVRRGQQLLLILCHLGNWVTCLIKLKLAIGP